MILTLDKIAHLVIVTVRRRTVQIGCFMNKISTYVKRYWYVYTLAILFLIISSGLNLIVPQFTKKIVDEVFTNGKINLMNHLILIILLLSIAKCIFSYLKEITFDAISSKIAVDIRRNLFIHIQNLSVHFFDKTNTGEVMSRIKDDVNSIWDALNFITMLLIQVIIHTTITIYCMFRLNAKLTLLPLAVMPVAAFIAIHMEKKLDSIYEEISEENAALTTVAQENIAGVRTVKAFAKEQHEIKKFLSHNKNYYDLNMKQAKLLVKYDPYFSFFSKALPIAVVILGGVIVSKGNMTLGTLVAFVEYSHEIVWPMEILGWLINSLASALAANKKLRKIYSEVSEVVESSNPVILPDIRGEVEFNHVDFCLGDKPILSDINFHLEPGKTIGIMGATGSGKTSIVNLLQRFYDATSGEIKLDGVNIKDLSLEQLRKSISSVMQDVFLFSDTINENIRMGAKDVLSDEDVTDASHLAKADTFIHQMEQQYETVIGERGIGLSGGQKQRISIARALAKNTPILIFDDSTSALDMETEYEIQQSLQKLQDVTKIIIAHRISAVRNADEILILENGAIKERGTHDELLRKRGYYYDTFLAQYGEAFLQEPKLA